MIARMNLEQAEKDFLDTARLFQEERYQEAIVVLDRIMPAFPNSIKLVQMRAQHLIALQLTGEAVETVLEWTPAQVDCGYATPGVQVNKQVTFTNSGNVDAQLSGIRTQNTTEFGILNSV